MSLYKLADSDIWWASVTVNGQRIRRSTGEYDQRAAQKVHDKLKAQHHDAPKLKGRTWGEAVLKWAKAETRSDSDLLSLAKFGQHYKDRLLLSVTADSLDKALREFTKTAGTHNRYVARLNAILKLSGSTVVVPKRRSDAVAREWITQEQWEKLYSELPAHLRGPALFAVSTGLRQSNVLGLQWSHVDLKRGHVWVEGYDTKSDKPIPVPLSANALEALHFVEGQNEQWCFTYRGKPIKDIKTAFMAACIRSGLGRMAETVGSSGRSDDKSFAYKGFTWHGLRHTWATWHVQNGTPLDVLMHLGGWSDLRMVLNYAHHSAGYLAAYVNNMKGKT